MRKMRKKFITIFAIVFATVIVTSACKAAAPSNETQTPDLTHQSGGEKGTIDDEWEMTSFDDEFDSSRFGLLKVRILNGTFKDIDSIIVVKHGNILIEEYFNGATPYTMHDIRSAGKSFTSALVGIAIDKGLINGVNDRLLSYFPEIERSND